jgi:hypothetical protein
MNVLRMKDSVTEISSSRGIFVGVFRLLVLALSSFPWGGTPWARPRLVAASALRDPCPAYTDSLVGCLLYDTHDTFDECSACVLDSVRKSNVAQAAVGPDIRLSLSTTPTSIGDNRQSARLETCQALESVLCSALINCPCPSCRQEYTDFLFCLVESELFNADERDVSDKCRFECPDGPFDAISAIQDGSSDSSAEVRHSPLQVCNIYRVQAARCYVESRLAVNDAVACHSCMAYTISTDGDGLPLACDDRQRWLACDAVSACPCDPCQTQELSYWDCLFRATANCTVLSVCTAVPHSPGGGGATAIRAV